jgi:hypothetical protein
MGVSRVEGDEIGRSRSRDAMTAQLDGAMFANMDRMT